MAQVVWCMVTGLSERETCAVGNAWKKVKKGVSNGCVSSPLLGYGSLLILARHPCDPLVMGCPSPPRLPTEFNRTTRVYPVQGDDPIVIVILAFPCASALATLSSHTLFLAASLLFVTSSIASPHSLACICIGSSCNTPMVLWCMHGEQSSHSASASAVVASIPPFPGRFPTPSLALLNLFFAPLDMLDWILERYKTPYRLSNDSVLDVVNMINVVNVESSRRAHDS